MARLLNWLWGRAVIFVLLAAGFVLVALAGPTVREIWNNPQAETLSLSEMRAAIAREARDRQAAFARARQDAARYASGELQARIAKLEGDREKQETLRDANSGFIASARPSRIVARAKAEIAIKAIDAELAALKAAREPRAKAEGAQAYLTANPMMPTEAGIAKAKAACRSAEKALADFEARWPAEQRLREAMWSQGSELKTKKEESCDAAAKAKDRRAKALDNQKQLRDAREALQAVANLPVPKLYQGARLISPRDILIKAFRALLAITLAPLAWRILAFYLLAPLAARWPPMRFGPAGAAPAPPAGERSAVSLGIVLGPDEEALVRQDYLQSSSLGGEKRTRWLLDWHHPFASLASGMRFLTAIRGAGERVTLSAVKDPFAELAVLEVPEGAACVLRPSALAAVVQARSRPLRIEGHWRVFSLPALLTWQWRYFAFHGPVRLVVKGGRGVRIEPADAGRIVGEGQVVGFSTDLAYAVIRSETFWPYFLGRGALLKDRLGPGGGAVLIEEAPLAGRSGLRRGIQGMADAALKLAGI